MHDSRTHVVSTMRFDGHLSNGYPLTYGHMYEGCSIYNETVLITFTFYEVQRHKNYKH